MSAFEELQSIPPQLLATGYLARAVHGQHLTLAIVEVAPDAVLPEHQHANEQFGMVIEGSVIFRVGDELQTIRPGGIWRIPPEAPHAVTGGPVGAVVVDVFSPPRDDWEAGERLVARAPQWPQVRTSPAPGSSVNAGLRADEQPES
jgi:quercetin dioxygenase-like cupin family protein